MPAKKTFVSTFGKVKLDKTLSILKGNKNGLSITPLLQSHYLKYCSEVVPQKACELLNTTLVSSNLTTTSQAYRLIDQYGSDPLLEEELCTPLQDEELLVNVGMTCEIYSLIVRLWLWAFHCNRAYFRRFGCVVVGFLLPRFPWL